MTQFKLRITIASNESEPFVDTFLTIELQERCGCSTLSRQRFDTWTDQAKMTAPLLSAWIKKKGNSPSFGIEGCDIWTFEMVAVETGPSEVFQYCQTAMLLGDNMIDLMGQNHQIFMQ